MIKRLPESLYRRCDGMSETHFIEFYFDKSIALFAFYVLRGIRSNAKLNVIYYNVHGTRTQLFSDMEFDDLIIYVELCYLIESLLIKYSKYINIFAICHTFRIQNDCNLIIICGGCNKMWLITRFPES